MTAVELYFQQLIQSREVSQVLISDLEGRLIMVQSAGANRGGDDEGEVDDVDAQGIDGSDSNVVISGARVMKSFDGLGFGKPQFLSVQYHDKMAVQFCEGSCLVSLIGSRSHDHCLGGLIALSQQMRSSVPAFRDMITAIGRL